MHRIQPHIWPNLIGRSCSENSTSGSHCLQAGRSTVVPQDGRAHAKQILQGTTIHFVPSQKSRSFAQRLLVQMPDLQDSLCLFDVSKMTTPYRSKRQRVSTIARVATRRTAQQCITVFKHQSRQPKLALPWCLTCTVCARTQS